MSHHKNQKRVCKSLKSPFTLEQLREFVDSLPTKASVRLVSVQRADLTNSEKLEDSSYLEAVWWQKEKVD